MKKIICVFVFFTILPILIFVGIWGYFACVGWGGMYEPVITEGEFPFRFVYELNGEIFEIEDVVVVRFNGFVSDGIWGLRSDWGAELRYGESFRHTILRDENVRSIFHPDRIYAEIEILLCPGFPGYYLGDPRNVGARPRLEHRGVSPFYNGGFPRARGLTHEQAYEYFGINVLVWEFSEPIENRFVRRRND